jgi:sRNA-binding regulator protein Hfq
MVRSWVGTRVEIELLTGLSVSGELLWVDRYTMCIKDRDAPAIVHKGAIAVIHQEGQVT